MTFPINPRATDMHEPHQDVWTRFAKACDERESEVRDNTADAFNTCVDDAFSALRIQYGGRNV